MNIFSDIVMVEVVGRNVDYYINKIIRNKINVFKMKKINYKTLYLFVSYNDYLKLIKYKSIYEVKLVKKLGRYRLRLFFLRNKYIILFIILGIILMYILNNIIFSIDIIHNDRKIRELVAGELNNYGIKKYRFKKKYSELNEIKSKILNNNKDRIEWLEIIEKGTKYIVRIEERLKNSNSKNNSYQNIVASKNAVISRIIAISGEKVKFENDFVNKGDIVISGVLVKPDNSNILVSAKGKVYGEVWYKVEVEYPYIYREENLTGKNKNIFVCNFFNKKFSLLDFNKYNSFKIDKKNLFSNNLFDIGCSIEKHYELNIIDDFLTEEEAIDKAINEGENKLISSNKKIESVNKIKIMSKEILSSKVKLKLFISVIEDIGISEVIENNN